MRESSYGMQAMDGNRNVTGPCLAIPRLFVILGHLHDDGHGGPDNKLHLVNMYPKP